MNNTYKQLCENLERLKLGQIKLHLNEVTDFITNNNLSFIEGLLKLTNYEVDYKAVNAGKQMIKAGAFPHHRELSDFDFKIFHKNITYSLYLHNSYTFLVSLSSYPPR